MGIVSVRPNISEEHSFELRKEGEASYGGWVGMRAGGENGYLTRDRFLDDQPLRVGEICDELRRLVVETVPDKTGAVYPAGWRVIGYRQMDRPRGRYFCFVAPMSDHARHRLRARNVTN